MSSIDIRFGKETVITNIYDGEKVSVKREHEMSVLLDKPELLKQMIDSLGIINSGQTRKLNIEVCLDSRGRYKMVTRWLDVA